MNQNNRYDEEIKEHHETLEKTKNFSNKQGMVTILLIFGLFGLWSIFAPIETTITASGKMITHSYNKSVKHTSGGIVQKIFVEEGDLVKKDQPLLQIESYEEESKLKSYITKHDNNVLVICRLNAEAKRKKILNCEESKVNLVDLYSYDDYMKEQRMLFNSDVRNFNAKINLLKSRNAVLYSQNKGLEQQIVSHSQLLDSYKKELKKWKQLLREDAIDELKAIETQRRVVEVTLQLDSLASRIEENSASIESHNQEIVFEEEQFKNTAFIKRNELILDNKITYQSIVSFQELVKNLTLKSPSDGLVTDMKIRSTGEVISPHKQIMSIVPNTQDLRIEAFVLPTDIEKLYIGQEVEVSFPAFVDPSALPVLGKIIYISADTITPENSKESFYTIRIEFTEAGLAAIKKNNFKIVPGMPTAAFIHTGKKTLSTYLLNPIFQMFKGIYHAN